LSSGFHLVGTLSAAYVVLTYRLPDVRQMARRTVSYLIITLLAVITYTAGFLVAQYVFQTVPGYSPLLAGAAMALVLAILFDPLLSLVQRLVNRLISGIGYDPSHTLREYSTSISNILDLERLATVAVGLISEAMEIRRGALFVVHHEKGQNGGDDRNGYFRLRGVIGMGEDLPPGILSADSPVAGYLRQERHPLTQYDIDLLPRFQATSAAERTWLSGLGMDVYVPIYAKGEWIGLLALGPKVSGDRYFDDDLILLSTLADQTAVALENARLFDDLKIRTTEIERLYKELAVANRELARLDQAKSDFINIASHELRTPLCQVLGYNDILGEMINDGLLTPDAGLQLTEGVGKAVQRLQEIVNTMFDVSQIDTETLVLELFPTSVALTVNEAVDTWAAALEERKQTLTVEGLADLPTILADSERLEQAFSHLIQNAIKFTPDGGRIRITGRLLGEKMPPQDQTIEVVVADNGIGIAPDDLEHIFEKFYRVGNVMLHSTGKTKFKGAGPGLGLTIARGIVGAHAGRIWAESPGCDEETCPGSEFHVVLPVQPRHLEAAGSEAFIAAVRAATDQVSRTI
jgi:signal transduction histidine kinase